MPTDRGGGEPRRYRWAAQRRGSTGGFGSPAMNNPVPVHCCGTYLGSGGFTAEKLPTNAKMLPGNSAAGGEGIARDAR